uniref:Uncharacterized protein n=1 Tax=Caenorhabditis japonica TaxID=281687 RepID=A0A8R1I130_CAEJA
MTSSSRSGSQRGVLTKSGALSSKKSDDNTPFSMSYLCVNKYLSNQSSHPVRMVLTCGQSVGNQSITVSVEKITRETALELADSTYFEAAFNLADNRKSLKKACQQARQFYMEHVLHKNPFPPRQKFKVVLERIKGKKEGTEQKSDVESNTSTTPKNTESSLSLVEGTMSLTSISSHNLAPTRANQSLPRTPKKRSEQMKSRPAPERVHHQIPKLMETPSIPIPHPPRPQKTATEENRLMNTFYTSE